MKITVSGKQIDVGDALRSHVESTLDETVSKYFDQAIEGTAVFSRDGQSFLQCDITVHVGRDLQMRGSGEAGDAHAAFDLALEHIAKRLRRQKRRLRSHRRRDAAEDTLEATQYILSPEEPEESAATSDDGQPVVIAEMATKVESLTVGDAVMRLDLTDAPVYVFRNVAHGGVNVVYRRPDGNIGWVDPRGNQPAD